MMIDVPCIRSCVGLTRWQDRHKVGCININLFLIITNELLHSILILKLREHGLSFDLHRSLHWNLCTSRWYYSIVLSFINHITNSLCSVHAMLVFDLITSDSYLFVYFKVLNVEWILFSNACWTCLWSWRFNSKYCFIINK